MNRIGCIDKHLDRSLNTAMIKIRLPKFKHNVLWTLSDLICAKLMGYQHQIQAVAPK